MVKQPLIAMVIALILALGGSLLGNFWQINVYLKQRDALVQAEAMTAKTEGYLEDARATTNACSDATDDLRELADKRDLAAVGVRQQAITVASKHSAKADAILAKPSPVPDNHCESAQVLIDDWLRERAKP